MSMDPKRLTELWSAHASSLRLLARARCVAAEDCVQEAFVRLVLVEPEPACPVAWLVRVVRNLAVDRTRSEIRRRRWERAAAKTEACWFQSKDDVGNGELLSEVQKSLQSLPVESREIVIAHLWNNLTFRQIGEAFDLPSSTVHRRYQEAIATLRTGLLCRAKE